MSDNIVLSPIGFVKSQVGPDVPFEQMRLHPTQIVVKPEFLPGLMGLKPEMDILVLYHFHRVSPESVELQLHPRHNPANPLRGVFATRSPFRPNRIGATVACIQAVEDNMITVKGLDAQDGTPVLDIKPYTTTFDVDTAKQRLREKQVSSLAEAREGIDFVDAEIIRLLGVRASYVHQVVNFKKTAEEVRAPARYAEVMRRRRELAEAAGLNPDVVEEMYKLLVDHFIKEEMDLLGLQDK